jgi:hypothetical protein
MNYGIAAEEDKTFGAKLRTLGAAAGIGKP